MKLNIYLNLSVDKSADVGSDNDETNGELNWRALVDAANTSLCQCKWRALLVPALSCHGERSMQPGVYKRPQGRTQPHLTCRWSVSHTHR